MHGHMKVKMLLLKTIDEISETYERWQLPIKRFICVRWGHHKNRLLQCHEPLVLNYNSTLNFKGPFHDLQIFTYDTRSQFLAA